MSGALPARRANGRVGEWRGLGRLRLVAAALVVLAAGAVRAASAWAHPLHTTLAELSVAPDGGVQIVLRTFVDDFSAVVTGRATAAGTPVATPNDSAVARYLGRTFVLADAAGRRAPLVVESVRRVGDLLWVTLRAPTLRSLAGARLTNLVLFERYDDQVNIVQTSVAGRRQTLLFTKRDGSAGKPI